jgi:hypothetical protein
MLLSPGIRRLEAKGRPANLAMTKYSCALSWETPDGPTQYAHKVVRFGVPRKDEAANGEVLNYFFRAEREGGSAPAASAVCTVPRTDKGRRFLDGFIAHMDVNEAGIDRSRKGRAGANDGGPALPVANAYAQGLPTVTVTAPYTYWYVAVVPNSWFYDDQWSMMSIFDTSGQGTSFWDFNPELIPPAECFPNSQKKCVMPLKDTDSSMLAFAVYIWKRPVSEFTDTVRRNRCKEAFDLWDQYFPIKVRSGAYNTTRVAPDTFPHTGNTGNPTNGDSALIHFDPWVFDSIYYSSNPRSWDWGYILANTALHEAWHMSGEQGHAHDDIYWPNELPSGFNYGTQYKTEPFKFLNVPELAGGESCLRTPGWS